ncbi:MAG: hypothetical protein ACJ76F_06790 [Bacteroidia bacterium]
MADLENTLRNPGTHKLLFSAKERGFGPGLYFIRLTIDKELIVKRLVEQE